MHEGSWIGNFHCVASEFKYLKPCNSSDALGVYIHETEEGVWYDGFCRSCGQFVNKESLHSSSLAAEFGIEGGKVSEVKYKPKPKPEPISIEAAKAFIKEIGYIGNGYRGIKDEYNQFYGHLTQINSGGEVIARYYPETVEGKLVGYKSRIHPKKFGYNNQGRTGISSQLSGQVKFNSGGKYCVPMDTQILTKEGWKYYQDISIGDIVLGYDQKTHTKQWTKITELHYFEEDDVYSFGNGLNYLRATSNHRWFVKQRVDRGKKGRSLESQIKTTKDFNCETRLVVNAPFVENGYDTFTDLELSTSKTGDFCAKILNMTHKERLSWLEGFALADGHYRKPRRPTEKTTIELHQNRGDIFEAALLCSYLVHDKIVRVQNHSTNKMSKNVCAKITLSDQEHRSLLTENMVKVGREPVWCVTTELGSWVMRQGDTINITGNCLIVGGEEDKVAAFQMLRDSQKERGQEDFDPVAVVSPTTGESSAVKQIAAQYEWFDTFENIIIGMDNDDVGREAAKAIADVLPSSKIKVALWSGKDPNKMLTDGKQRQFLRDFYNAKDYVDSGVKTSVDADEEMEVELARPKIPLPPFMHKLQHIMAGGIPLGYIVNLAAQTGGGKTTIINEMIYYWIFNSPYKIGIMSLELNAGQYQATMLSRHIGKKIALIEDPNEAVNFVQQPWVQEKRKELRENEFGEPRYTILDERDGDLKQVEKKLDLLIKKHQCKLIIIDPIQDIFEGVSLEQQQSFIKYLKGVIKDGITIFNVCHITKGRTEVDKEGKRKVRQLTEDDFAGVSNVAKSGGCNIFATRDKYAEDKIEQNTTLVEVPKCRWSGRAGNAGKWYYCNETHKIYELEDWEKSVVLDNPEQTNNEVIDAETGEITDVGEMF